jgi:DNA invertase Pin-like site-specific DNA recombinase
MTYRGLVSYFFKGKKRPILNQLLGKIRNDDSITVTDLSRISRSVTDLIKLVQLLKEKNVKLISLKEPWVGGEDLTSRLLFAIISHLNEFERDCLIDRTRAGLASARAKGKVGGRKPMKQSIIDNAIALYDSNTAINVSEICTIFKISRKTFYKYLNLKNKQKLQIEQKIEKIEENN